MAIKLIKGREKLLPLPKLAKSSNRSFDLRDYLRDFIPASDAEKRLDIQPTDKDNKNLPRVVVYDIVVQMIAALALAKE